MLTRTPRFVLALIATLFTTAVLAQAAVMAPSPVRQRASQPIEKAAAKGDDEEVKRLFAAASPEARYGALDILIRKKELELAEWLLKQGVHPTDIPQGQYDALGSAAQVGNVPAIELLCRYKADANKPGFLNERPLHRAIDSTEAKGNRTETVRALLACGADPRIRDQELYRQSGDPGLHYGDEPTLASAVMTRNTEMVRLLLDHGAVIEESADCCTEKLLLNAVHQPDMLKLLLDRGGAKAIPGPVGAKLVAYVACARHPDHETNLAALRTLVALKAPVDFRGYISPPLICAAEHVDVEMVRLLLEAGADVNFEKRPGRGDTAAAAAIEAYRDPEKAAKRRDISEGKAQSLALEIVQLLVDRGANPEVDEEIWRAARKDDEMGAQLQKPTQAWYAQLLRECLAAAPRAVSARLKPTAPASTPDRVYSPALINVFNELPVPDGPITFSPDGRWMAYEARGSSELVLQSLASNKTYRFGGSGRLAWGADSKALSPGRGDSVIDLVANPPVLTPRKGFVAARRPGEAPCLEWDEREAKPWPMSRQPQPGEFALSPDFSVRYHVVELAPTRHALVAEKESRQEQLLVHDVAEEFRKENEKLKAMVEELVRQREAEGADGRKMREQLSKNLESRDPKFGAGDYLLSPTGRYLYYSVTPDRPLRDDQQSQFVVVDVKARPVRVWEIDAAVDSVVWHPNGRELWFLTDVGPETGPPMRRERAQRLAAVAFPE